MGVILLSYRYWPKHFDFIYIINCYYYDSLTIILEYLCTDMLSGIVFFERWFTIPYLIIDEKRTRVNLYYVYDSFILLLNENFKI